MDIFQTVGHTWVTFTSALGTFLIFWAAYHGVRELAKHATKPSTTTNGQEMVSTPGFDSAMLRRLG